MSEEKKEDKDEVKEVVNKLNEEESIKNISKYTSIKLADIVIAYRYLGLYEKLSLAAMEELGVRRGAGDIFDFEKYIEDNIKTLPKLEFKIADISEMIKGLGSLKGFSFKK